MDGLVVQNHQLTRTQRQCGIGASIIVAELDLVHALSKQLDHGADLPSAQSSRWEVLCQRHDVQDLRSRVHVESPFSEDVATRETREVLSPTNDPTAADDGPPRGPGHGEVYHVPLPVAIPLGRDSILRMGGSQQRIPQLFGVIAGQAKRSQKNPGLMPTARVSWVEAVVAKFLQVDDSSAGVGHSHSAVL